MNDKIDITNVYHNDDNNVMNKKIKITKTVMTFDFDLNVPENLPYSEKLNRENYDNCLYEITSIIISYFEVTDDFTTLLGTNNQIFNLNNCSNEKEMLLQFTNSIRTNTPNMIVGYNIKYFHFNYLRQRAIQHNIETEFSRFSNNICKWKAIKKMRYDPDGGHNDNYIIIHRWYDIKDITIVDTRRFFTVKCNNTFPKFPKFPKSLISIYIESFPDEKINETDDHNKTDINFRLYFKYHNDIMNFDIK